MLQCDGPEEDKAPLELENLCLEQRDVPLHRTVPCSDPESSSGAANPAVCTHTRALGCSPLHARVRARAKPHTSKARQGVHVPVPARGPTGLCTLTCATPRQRCAHSRCVCMGAPWRVGPWRRHQNTRTSFEEAASALLSRNIWGTSGSHQRDSEVSLEEQGKEKRE